MAGRDALVEIDEHVERAARRHAAVIGVEPPATRLRLRNIGFEIGAHAVGSSPDAGSRLDAHAGRLG
jgi:hypothetical protein